MLKLCAGSSGGARTFHLSLRRASGSRDETGRNAADSVLPGTRRVAGALLTAVWRAGWTTMPSCCGEIDAINRSGCKLLFVSAGRAEAGMVHVPSRGADPGAGRSASEQQRLIFSSGRVSAGRQSLDVQDAGLEWLYRFCAEPQRLWRRYLFYNPYFVARLMLQKMGLDRPSRELVPRFAGNSISK